MDIATIATVLAALLAAWPQTQRPFIHVQHILREPHSPLRPDRTGNAFKPDAAPRPGEPIFRNAVNGAFIGTALETCCRAQQIDTAVLGGLTTDHGVSTTTRMAVTPRVPATVVSDATVPFERTGPDGEHQ